MAFFLNVSNSRKKTDVENTFLSRREITCDFNGLGGSLTKIQALEMVTKEYGLDGKTVVPMILENHVGRTQVTGTFYVYDDVKLAKSHVIPNIFARLEKANAKIAEKAEEEEKKKASAKEAEKEAVTADSNTTKLSAESLARINLDAKLLEKLDKIEKISEKITRRKSY